MKLLFAVPTFENIEPDTFKSIFDLDTSMFDAADFKFIRGYDCAKARNVIAKHALDGEYDYVFMVDSDVVVPADTLAKFMQKDTRICLGVYPRKNEYRKAELFSENSESFTKANQYGFNEIKQLKTFYGATHFLVKGGGLGCALIDVSVFKALEYPYFLYVNYPNETYLSEDLYFCTKAREQGIDIWASTEVFCGHVKKQVLYE